MKVDKAGTKNLNQKQASPRLTNEGEAQLNPSVKFDPRQESNETDSQAERETKTATPNQTVEDAPSVDSTKGGL